MKKISIRHIPKCVDIAMVVLGIMIVATSFSLKGTEKPKLSDAIYLIGISALFFAGIILAVTVRTTVKFGEGSIIRCRWLFLFWKIDLDQVVSVSYTLRSYMTRGGGRSYCFDLFFYTASEKYKRLTEHLNYQVAEDCIRRKYDNVQLIQLYRYIEEIAPDKAIGRE